MYIHVIIQYIQAWDFFYHKSYLYRHYFFIGLRQILNATKCSGILTCNVSVGWFADEVLGNGRLIVGKSIHRLHPNPALHQL